MAKEPIEYVSKMPGLEGPAMSLTGKSEVCLAHHRHAVPALVDEDRVRCACQHEIARRRRFATSLVSDEKKFPLQEGNAVWITTSSGEMSGFTLVP
jgi:hypothetical protein